MRYLLLTLATLACTTMLGAPVALSNHRCGHKGMACNAPTGVDPNVAVDFAAPAVTLAPHAFSGTISTYGENGGSIAASVEQRSRLSSLGLGLYRVPLQWNGGNVISSAGGGPADISGDEWISQIKAVGAEPMIVLGGSSDNNFTPEQAAQMVQHFNGAGGNRVGWWVVGNEPSNGPGGMTMSAYISLFNATYDAMKAVDPTIKVVGPAWTYYDEGALREFLRAAGSRVDVVDYHHYAMGVSYLDDATALRETVLWENEVNRVRQIIAEEVPARAGQIGVQVGEYNWSWRTANGYPGWNGDDRFYEAVVTVWTASVAGHIAKAGGRGHQYADQNGALGLTFEKTTDAVHFGQTLNDPMPIYHGLRMFTGGRLFRGFGARMVTASTTLTDVEVFASTEAKNIVLINKSPSTTRSAVVGLRGFTGGSADVWQTRSTAPFAEPVRISSRQVGASISVSLPPYSVTTIVLT